MTGDTTMFRHTKTVLTRAEAFVVPLLIAAATLTTTFVALSNLRVA